MFRIIIITSPDFFPGETEIINSLFQFGLYRLHIRKPEATAQQTEEFINKIEKTYHNRIVLHDYHELAIKYSLGGIHLNSRNPKAPKEYDKLGTISRSCHSFEEIIEKKSECDYLSLSPIFNSISKHGYKSNFTSSQISAAKAAGIIDKKIYALGGIGAENISQIKRYGFGGAMILGYIWENNGFDTFNRFIELNKKAN